MLGLLRGAPHTVQLVESFVDEQASIPVIVLAPLCDGTLYDRIEAHPFSPYTRDHALRWSLQLCTAVLEFMRRDVCHEDLSAKNVLLDGGDLWVADPGVALEALHYGIPSGRALKCQSRTLAPEINNGRFDMRSDWFSVGACMWLLFTGSTSAPVAGGSFVSLVAAHGTREALAAAFETASEALLPDAAERRVVSEVVCGLLEPRPQDRMTPSLAINRLGPLLPGWSLPGREGLVELLKMCEENQDGDHGIGLLKLSAGLAKLTAKGKIKPMRFDSDSKAVEDGADYHPDALYALEEAWWRMCRHEHFEVRPMTVIGAEPTGSILRPAYESANVDPPCLQLAGILTTLAKEHRILQQRWWALQLVDAALEQAKQ